MWNQNIFSRFKSSSKHFSKTNKIFQKDWPWELLKKKLSTTIRSKSYKSVPIGFFDLIFFKWSQSFCFESFSCFWHHQNLQNKQLQPVVYLCLLLQFLSVLFSFFSLFPSLQPATFQPYPLSSPSWIAALLVAMSRGFDGSLNSLLKFIDEPEVGVSWIFAPRFCASWSIVNVDS